MSENSQWVSVNEAAAAARLPVRTVYNWVNSETVPSRKQDGVTLVCMEQVVARAQERAVVQPVLPALLPPASAPATDAGRETTGEALPPDLFAHVIRLIEQGIDLPAIVQELRLPTSLALEAKRQYDLLVAASGRPSLRQLMSELADRFDSRMAEFDYRVASVESERETLRRRVIQDVRTVTGQWYSDLDERILSLSASFSEGPRSAMANINSGETQTGPKQTIACKWISGILIRSAPSTRTTAASWSLWIADFSAVTKSVLRSSVIGLASGAVLR